MSAEAPRSEVTPGEHSPKRLELLNAAGPRRKAENTKA